jgi:Tol biopolymer transport system component
MRPGDRLTGVLPRLNHQSLNARARDVVTKGRRFGFRAMNALWPTPGTLSVNDSEARNAMRLLHVSGVMLLMIAIVTSCGDDSEDPTATSQPQSSPVATHTSTPIATPTPTVSSTPTPEPAATATHTTVPLPSPTPEPTVTMTDEPTATPDPVAYNEIIFDGLMVDGDLKLRYFVIDADGSNLHTLTTGPDEFEGALSLSPDGRRGAFIRESGGVFIVDVETGEEQRIIDGRATVDWSPDGTRLVLGWQEHSTGPSCCGGDRRLEDPPKIVVIAADGSHRWVLSESTFTETHGWVIDEMPVWSPNGAWIAFHRYYSGAISRSEQVEGAVPKAALVIAAADGSDLHEIDTGNIEPGWTFSWTPNSNQIVFEGRVWGSENGSDNLYVVDLDGSGLTTLSQERHIWRLQFAPDGNSMAFLGLMRDQYDPVGLFSVNLDGSELTRLTDPGIRVSSFAYSPDGSMMLIEIFDPESESSTMRVVHLDSSGVREFTSLGNSSMPAVWSPDSTRFAHVGNTGLGMSQLTVVDVQTGTVFPLAEVGVAEAGGGRVWWTSRD